jgi:hypothetical protein
VGGLDVHFAEHIANATTGFLISARPSVKMDYPAEVVR